MKINYAPHADQAKIHAAFNPHRNGWIVMVVAGRRFGKTILAVNEIIKRAIETARSRIWYVAPTKDQAYRIAWRELFRFLPRELIVKKREDRHSVELSNGSLIEMLGVQDEIFLLGAGLDFIVLDEFWTIPYSVWYDTLKPMLMDHNGDALFIGTVPDPKIHNITIEYMDMYEAILHDQNNVQDPHARAFNFSTFSNPYINHDKLKRDIADLKTKGREGDADRLYYGKYTRELGVVFPKFSYDKHTVLPFDIPKDWFRLMAVDPHPQKPIHGLWCAVDPKDHFWFYRESDFIGPDGRSMTVNEAAHEIMLLEAKAKENTLIRLIDPTFAKVDLNVVRSKSVKDMFRDQGLYFREASREFVTFYEKFTDALVDFPETSVHFLRSCPNLIRQILHLTWESWNSSRAREERGVKNKPKKVDDDFVDCMKYIYNANVKPPNMDQLKTYQRDLEQRWAENRFL